MSSFHAMMTEMMAAKEAKIARKLEWDRRFLRLCEEVRSWSKDPSSKVGAVIVNEDRIVVGLGYNGFPRGTSDDIALYNDRPTKLARVIHAEVNAILNANGSTKGTTLYLTGFNGPPCDRCSAHIIQAGIKRVVYLDTGQPLPERWADQINASFEILRDAGVLIESVTAGDGDDSEEHF